MHTKEGVETLLRLGEQVGAAASAGGTGKTVVRTSVVKKSVGKTPVKRRRECAAGAAC